MAGEDIVTLRDMDLYGAELSVIEELEAKTAADGGETVLPL